MHCFPITIHKPKQGLNTNARDRNPIWVSIVYENLYDGQVSRNHTILQCMLVHQCVVGSWENKTRQVVRACFYLEHASCVYGIALLGMPITSVEQPGLSASIFSLKHFPSSLFSTLLVLSTQYKHFKIDAKQSCYINIINSR